MGKLWLLINEFLIAMSSFISGLRKTTKKDVEKGTILIPYANILGDIVLFIDCIDEFERLYPKDKGYNVLFLCRPEVNKLLFTIFPQCTLNVKVVDWHKFDRNFIYYRKTIQKYDSTYEKVIVPYNHTITNDLFVRSISAKEKITQDYDIKHKKVSIFTLLRKNTYTNLITVNKNISVLEQQRILIHHLGDKEFKSRMPYINPIFCEMLKTPENYIVFCPTASYAPKGWPIKSFAKVADFFIEKYNCKICICGGNENPEIFKKMYELVKNNGQLVNCINRTNFGQWVELIRGAKLALCNDSASYHIAAAVKTPTVCVAGDFACVNAPLYEPDILTEEDVMPVVLYKKMPCEGCKYIGYKYGYGNKECKNSIRKCGCLLCVKIISVETVISALEAQVKKYDIKFG